MPTLPPWINESGIIGFSVAGGLFLMLMTSLAVIIVLVVKRKRSKDPERAPIVVNAAQ